MATVSLPGATLIFRMGEDTTHENATGVEMDGGNQAIILLAANIEYDALSIHIRRDECLAQLREVPPLSRANDSQPLPQRGLRFRVSFPKLAAGLWRDNPHPSDSDASNGTIIAKCERYGQRKIRTVNYRGAAAIARFRSNTSAVPVWRVSRLTTISTRNPSGMVTRPGWLNGTGESLSGRP